MVATVLCLFSSLSIKGQNVGFESKELQQAASLLSKEVPYAEMLYRFTETYLNRLMDASDQEKERMMRADDVRIVDGGLERLNLVGEETSLAMRSVNNRYSVSLSNGNFRIIELSCPMSFQLISQKKLKELEEDFLKELAAYKMSEAEPERVEKSKLKETAPHLYMYKGNDYYLHTINNDLYYIDDNGKLGLVYDSGYIAESICNMLLSEDTPCDISLRLSVRQYGFKTDELLLPLKQWIAYSRGKGCDLYVGIEKMETDGLKATVFAVNESFKYNHVMNINVPYSLLDNKKGEVEADITIYIPTHNLKSLFEEFNLNNKKKK